MTETLPRLLALQACDQRIRHVTHTVATLRQSLATLREEEQAGTQAIRARQDKVRETEQTRDHLTQQLDQVQGQLRDKRHALHHRRAGQQNEAVQREMALLEAQEAALEEELRTRAHQLSQDTEALRRAEATATAHHEEVSRTTATVLGQTATAEAELRAAQHERLTLVSGIRTSLLHEYERIFAHRNGVAVVAIVGETCQRCHLRLPPQLCLELQKNPRLVLCLHCHRIVFATQEASRPLAELPSLADNADGHRPRPPQRRPRVKAHAGKTPPTAGVPQGSPAQV